MIRAGTCVGSVWIALTRNIYQYLCQQNAAVDVYRNDAISVEELIELDHDIIVLSPGPGHPLSDSGICADVLKHFMGKKPIFGICMGQQVMYHVFGGVVSYAGEIVHGKTSCITHDGKGFFSGVPQGILVTRYHSLAGTVETLPEDLEITARTDGGVVMGVRHKKYVLEGVQFHPELILTEEGMLMIRNILLYSCGTWEEEEAKRKTLGSSSKLVNILETIYDQRKKDYEKIENTPGKTFADLETLYNLGLYPPAGDFYKALQLPGNAVIAEIKRASPSKGNISKGANSVLQAQKYIEAGATAILVLTEPHWFKGSLDDLRNVRALVDRSEGSRPLILRKEFIFSKYQILEARLAGADTVLLIVKMLTQAELKTLYDYAVSLKMEPLVEVNTCEEMARAVELGARVIGVNNRDLTTFNVDLERSSSLVGMLPEGAVMLALSGIFDGKTAAKYRGDGIKGFLVGEALMKGDVHKLVHELKTA